MGNVARDFLEYNVVLIQNRLRDLARIGVYDVPFCFFPN